MKEEPNCTEMEKIKKKTLETNHRLVEVKIRKVNFSDG